MQLRVLQQNANRCPGTGHAEKGPSPPQPASQDAHVLVPRLSRPTSPRKRAASTRFVKLLVITRLLSFVGSSSVIAFTLGSSWKVVARFPGRLRLSTRSRASDTINPGLPTARAALPRVRS